MASTARAATIVPPPPRTTGDDASDTRALLEWAWEFYTSTVVQSGLLDPSYQSDSTSFDANNPPDPTRSSVALAQRTANEALARVKALEP